MTEDFNEAPVAIEDKQTNLQKIKAIEIDEIKCQTCKKTFHLSYQLKEHMDSEKNHNSIQIKRKGHQNFEDIKCNICSEANIKKLYAILSGAKIDEIKSIIYCKTDVPQGFDNQPLIDIIEQENNINRKLNKVQLSYSDKYRYYNIYKALAIADMKYTRKLYEKKDFYEFKLLQNKEIYYFLVPENFCEMNLTPGRVLDFTEECDDEEEEEDDEDFGFLAVITKTEYIESKENKEENKIKIMINPINRHITSLEGHTGKYKIKEGFCLIPYERMLAALDDFVNDSLDDENEIYERSVSLYLTERIMGKLPFNEKSNKKVEEILKIEKNTVECILFKENNFSFVKEIEGFGVLNESQIKALENIFKRPLNLIQGPPGTGKTFLASFIIYNIFNMRKISSENHHEPRILICAPSNAAADNITSYLLRINNVTGKKMKILRVYAKTREYLEINEEIKQISLHKHIKDIFGEDLIFNDKSEIDDKTKEIKS